MKEIPFTGAAIITRQERESVSQALEEGAKALMQFAIDQSKMLQMIAEQAESMSMLMQVQTQITDCIRGAVAEGLSAEDLAHNLTTILAEYTA